MKYQHKKLQFLSGKIIPSNSLKIYGSFDFVMETLSFCTFNCRRLKTDREPDMLKKVFPRKAAADVIFLQQTSTEGNLPEPLKSWGYIRHPSHSPGGRESGLAFAVRGSLSDYEFHIHQEEPLGHYIHATLRINGRKFYLFNVCFPEEHNKQTTWTDVLQVLLWGVAGARLEWNLRDDEGNAFVIVGGDFNCTSASEIDRFLSDESRRKTANWLCSVVGSFSLVDPYGELHSLNEFTRGITMLLHSSVE